MKLAPEPRVFRGFPRIPTDSTGFSDGLIKWTRLSCHRFKDNQVRLQLFALAYNLGNFLRRLALPREVKQWSLTTLREKLIKVGAKVVIHARPYDFSWPKSPCLEGYSRPSWGGPTACGPSSAAA